jgi:3-oxoacyl-[acyl-carrier-protein] synthase II
MSRARVVITGIGTVNGALTGTSRALGDFLAAPRPAVHAGTDGVTAGRLPDGALATVVDPEVARRLSRVCQLATGAARLALGESGYDPAAGLGLVVGSEFGDLRSTREFVQGYLDRGIGGLSALLFPNTVMNTMAAAAAIAVGARERSLTLNIPDVAGELAIARGAAAVASGRAAAVLAGGVDELAPLVLEAMVRLGDGANLRGEGATFLLLETLTAAQKRGATVLGEIRGAAWRVLPARPHGVGHQCRSRAIPAALQEAATPAAELGWMYDSASGDAARDAWAHAVAEKTLDVRPCRTSLHGLLGHHAGLGALRVAAAAWTAREGLLPVGPESAGGGELGGTYRTVSVARRPGLVHALARGGAEVAVVVASAGDAP